MNGVNFSKSHDICLCRIPEIILPILPLSPDEYFIGSELGIVGFPKFERLQRISVQPYALKAILSSRMMYPFEIDGELVESERIALDCIAGEGFSGSPVFSIRDGKIVGMIDYLPLETDFTDVKIIVPSLFEGNARVQYPGGISFAIPSTIIQKYLLYNSKINWEDPSYQTVHW